MAGPRKAENASFAPHVDAPATATESDLLTEILSAEADFERGDYIDLTPEQLARCIETGEFPWSDESPPEHDLSSNAHGDRVQPRSASSRAVFATIGALGDAESLPGPGDFETPFPPGPGPRASASGHNVRFFIGSTRITCS